MSVATAPRRRRVQAAFIGREIVAGLVTSLLPLVNCFTFSALIFSGPWLPMLNQGVAILLVSGAVTAIVAALTSGFRIAVAGPLSLTSAALATMLVRLAPEVAGQPAPVAAATAMTSLGAATLATALVLLALGALRLGKMVRFTPYPVIAGFMGATGWVMIDAAVRMATDLPLDIRSLPSFADPAKAALLAGLVAFAALLITLTRRFRHPLTIPSVLALGALAFDTGLHFSGHSLGAARAAGLLFDAAGPGAPSSPLWSGSLQHTDWHAILHVAPSFAPVVVLGVVQALVSAAALEVALDTETDLDHELSWQGAGNLASAAAGGIVGFISTTLTSANQAAHGRSRLSALVVGGVLLASLAGGSTVVSFMPRIVLGGMLMMLGSSLLWDWAVASRLQLAPQEWLLTMAMIVIAATFGFLPSLLVGLVGSCALLAVSLSQTGVVRHSYGLNEASSALQRSETDIQALGVRGAEAHVIELSGILFFGSAYQLLTQVKSIVAAGRVRALVLDFTGVIGIDSSAGAVLGRVRSLIGRAGTRLIVSGLRALAPPPAIMAGSAAVTVRATLDEAIEAAEDEILAAQGAPRDVASAELWLTEALGTAAAADILCSEVHLARYAAGAVLCREGDAADTLFFVASGRVSATIASADGPAIRVRAFGPHTIIGELGFFLGASRNATLQVEQPASIGQLDRATFRRLGGSHPDVAVALLEYIARVQAERLSFATRQIVALRR